MMTASQSHMERHVAAMLDPVTPVERTASTLFSELTVLADRYKDDSVMVRVVEHIGSALIALGNADLGRIDPSTLDKQVRDVVRRAGGDTDDL